MDDTSKRIFVYNICLISISDKVSDGAMKTLDRNTERYSAILFVYKFISAFLPP